MSHWTVYWVMQADTIQTCVIVMAVGLWLAAGVALFGSFASMQVRKYESDEKKLAEAKIVSRWMRYSAKLAILGVLAMVSLIFIPSTKTLCACIAIPAIANNDKLKGDATEIYKLGMERLKEALQ
jgi:hypothetical protein